MQRTLLTLTLSQDVAGLPSGEIRLTQQQIGKYSGAKVRSYCLFDEEDTLLCGFLATSDKEAIVQGLATICELLVPEQMSTIVDANGVHA